MTFVGRSAFALPRARVRPQRSLFEAAALLAAGLGLALVAGCGPDVSVSDGEVEPGDEVSLGGGPVVPISDDPDDPDYGYGWETGALGTDPLHDRTFVMRTLVDLETGARLSSKLFVVEPSGSARRLIDSAPLEAPRLLFSPQHVVVVQRNSHGDVFRRFDRDSLTEVDEVEPGAVYDEAQVSPSGRYVVATKSEVYLEGDEPGPPAEVRILDLTSGTEHVLSLNRSQAEAGWLQDSDQLVVVRYRYPTQPDRLAHLLSWRLPEVGPFAPTVDEDGLWTEPLLSVVMDDVGPPSWGRGKVLTPDRDGLIAFAATDVVNRDEIELDPTVAPLRRDSMLLVDSRIGEVVRVPDIGGPVSFTDDGGHLLGHRTYWAEEGELGCAEDSCGYPVLVLVDLDTLIEEERVVPELEGGMRYWPARGGRYVLLADPAGEVPSLRYDVELDVVDEIAGGPVKLSQFVARPSADQVWLIEGDALLYLDVGAELPVWLPLEGLRAGHLGLLPGLDRVVVDDLEDPAALHLVDPDAAQVVSSPRLPLSSGT